MLLLEKMNLNQDCKNKFETVKENVKEYPLDGKGK